MMLAGNFNATPLSDPPVLGAVVPEPWISASVVAVAMIGVFLRRRKSGSAIRN
jgi:hypothetical protein